jgi:hypothetical protein
MATIIAGEFATMEETEAAAAALRAADFSQPDVSVFMLNSPGQHGLHPLGGDQDADPGASKTDKGAVSGAVIGGAVGLGVGAASLAATDVGPAIAATAAAVGAYTGSLIGALNKTGNHESPEPPADVRHAGAMVAVNTTSQEAEQNAIEILRAHGAGQIERAEGRWEDGKWLDFDPRATPNIVGGLRAGEPNEQAPGASR